MIMFNANSYTFCVRINGCDAAFSRVGLARTGLPKICTSVSVFVYKDGQLLFHVLLDVGPGVTEAIQSPFVQPAAFPLDWVILSHAHPDHWLGLDALCGDYYRNWARGVSDAPPRLKLLCLTETFDHTVGKCFPHLKKKLDHCALEPGVPFPLWTDGKAGLDVVQVEVKHFRRSCVTIFTFRDGEKREERVVCLFDIDDFHAVDSGAAQAGGAPDHWRFRRPDLLIAEANTFGERATGHISFERLAHYIAEWEPHQCRIVHCGAFEDMLSPNSPEDYWRAVSSGLLVHPRFGPAPDWVLTAAIQARLADLRYPHPLTASYAKQGEVLVVDPRYRREEELLVVKRSDNGGIRITSTVPRSLAHSHGISHTSVLLLPCVPPEKPGEEGRLVIHRRSPHKVVAPKKRDICGGHVDADGEKRRADLLSIELVMKDALREANEELTLHPYQRITATDLVRFGALGDFGVETHEEKATNVEISTAFVVYIPAGSQLTVQDTTPHFGTEELQTEEFTLDELLNSYATQPDDFADGLGRVLARLLESRRTQAPELEVELRRILRRE